MLDISSERQIPNIQKGSNNLSFIQFDGNVDIMLPGLNKLHNVGNLRLQSPILFFKVWNHVGREVHTSGAIYVAAGGTFMNNGINVILSGIVTVCVLASVLWV